MKKEQKEDQMSSATMKAPTRTAAYMNINQVAELIGASRTSIKTMAHKFRIGVFIEDKLVALSKSDAKKLRSKIRKKPGNPDFG